MNIVIISANSKFQTLFKKHDETQAVLLWDTVNRASIEIDAVLLDGKTFDLDDLKRIREQFPNIPVYYLPDTVKSDVITRNITRLCSAYRVKVINEYTTEEQVVEMIMNELTNKEDYMSKRIISFFGTHSGAGVTTTVLSLARALSMKVEERVLVLSLNSWDPADYLFNLNGVGYKETGAT